MKPLYLILPLLSFGSSLAQDFGYHCDNGIQATENPIGTCTEPGHIWIAPGCKEGFFCEDATGAGCHMTCPGEAFLIINSVLDYWECRVLTGSGIACPPDGFNFFTDIDINSTPAPPDAEDVTGNPIGTCHCDGEFWLAEGCKFGFICDSNLPDGGTYLSCPEKGETLIVDFETREWSCTTDIETCPGGTIEGAGCIMPECDQGNNPLGVCGCDNQFFINEDCTEGFLCTSNVPDPYLFDGCIQKCFDGQVLRPNFETNSWQCLAQETYSKCPGSFNLQCPDETVGQDFDSSICECESGQLFISGDCKEGFFCQSRLPGGGSALKCEGDEILTINLDTWNWQCSSENPDQCPGLGGFKVGCNNGAAVTLPPLKCNDEDFVKNPLGTCGGCEGQIFVNDKCSESFYCSQYTPDGDSEGCHLQCPDGQRVLMDLVNKEWDCVEREADFVCPGEFAVDCPEDDTTNTVPVVCNCMNEFWVNEDCTQGFMCRDAISEDGINPGMLITCPEETPIVTADLVNGAKNPTCSVDMNQCPGSYHFGCFGGDNPGPGATTESPGSPSGAAKFKALAGSCVFGALIGIFM